ncbi:type IV toxin-antitoxin system AbiEi family antitoxin domain-containing protein [Variovorax sp. YR566]|uniref:type IV toxin-antitoxin system AbiEi family antitoxin domain-containing protein n=1 Tax=Variovorax sp. YR566 TaxID=3450237 RepID=UPI003F80E1EF
MACRSSSCRTTPAQDSRDLVESVRNLRLPILENLLAHTTRIKVVRLARALSEELDLPWAPLGKVLYGRLPDRKDVDA